MKKIKILNIIYIIFPILALSFFVYSALRNDGDKDINYAKETMGNINKIRIAVDKYYEKTGEIPNLNLQDSKEGLEEVKNKILNSDEIISFKDIYGTAHLPYTPEFKGIEKSNKVYDVEDFSDVTHKGGWNYNKKTGEIHANLPEDFFGQGIVWDTF